MNSAESMDKEIQALVTQLSEVEALVALTAYFAGDRFDLVHKDVWVYPYAVGSSDVSVSLKRKGFICKVGHAEMHDAYRITALGKIVMHRYAKGASKMKQLVGIVETEGLEVFLESTLPLTRELLTKHSKLNPRALMNEWDEVGESV